MTGSLSTQQSSAAERKARPLWLAFHELRRRGFPLGVDDYSTALKALNKVEIRSRDELGALCEALWAKSPEDALQLREVRDDHRSR